ncbi:tyrosine-type recombinase/integrase [Microvirga makkahensis]|uniref:Tyrosine-type recombinase/integrase n=1 Tax=Microvirga makkahensis TaxID=1128670 RepID=A0A7X3MSR5_9HYPH|nr:tyrosine-type recombinase/integrase [Microvirga makkahensis]
MHDLRGQKTAWRRTLAKEETGVTAFRFHDSRHTAATRLLRSSGHLRLVQRLLRHEISPRRPDTRTSRTSI